MTSLYRFLLLCCLSVSLLSGCNTTRGIGEDIRDLGNIISRAAS
ncbi:entericidin A/B family lipoprotein [Shimwellia blattae]|nr:entericidin A [Shimwellia blattae]VEC27086.1 entericidin A [Shimwellia blattae]